MEPWAVHEGVLPELVNDQFAIGIDLVTGEEMDNVVKVIVDRLGDILAELSRLQSSKG